MAKKIDLTKYEAQVICEDEMADKWCAYVRRKEDEKIIIAFDMKPQQQMHFGEINVTVHDESGLYNTWSAFLFWELVEDAFVEYFGE